MKAILFILTTLISTALSAKVLSAPFSRLQRSYTPSRHIKRKTVQGNAINAVQLITYYTNVTIGTPPQPVGLVLDTGSSDTWVPTSAPPQQPCSVSPLGCPYGTFDPSASSTYRNSSSSGAGRFVSTYGVLQRVEGSYMTDNFAIDGVLVKDLNMALVTNATLPPKKDLIFEEPTLGILGLGFDGGQVNHTHCPAVKNCKPGDVECYEPCLRPGFLDRLVRQGAIGSRAFSLFLNNLEAKEGTILFGGLDEAQFAPPLLAVDVLQPGLLWYITLTSLAIDAPPSPGSRGEGLKAYDVPAPLRVLLDSGAEATFLPPALAHAVQADAGARQVEGIYYPIIDCAQATNQTLLHFGFGGDGGPVIAVPKSELVIPRFDARGVCEFGIWTSRAENSTKLYTIGDTFLRSAYVVYNMDNYTISLAQAVYNVNESRIVEITSPK